MVQEKFGLIAVKKIFYVLAMGVCLLAACKKSHPNKVEEALINNAKADNPKCICNPYIKKYQWQGETVYMQYINSPSCDGFPIFYNSNGERFNLPQGVTFAQFLAESTLTEVLWSCNEGLHE